jgi:hypothetical protein
MVKRANLKFVEVTNRQFQELEILRAKLSISEMSAPQARKKSGESATRGAASTPTDVAAVTAEFYAELSLKAEVEGATMADDDAFGGIRGAGASSDVTESATSLAAAIAVSPSAQVSDGRGGADTDDVDAAVDAASLSLSNAFSNALLHSASDFGPPAAAPDAVTHAPSPASTGDVANAAPPRPSSAARYERPTSAAAKRALSPPHPVLAAASAALELLSEETAALSVDDDDASSAPSNNARASAASPFIEMPVTSATAAHNIAALLLQEVQAASPAPTASPLPASTTSLSNNLAGVDARPGSAARPVSSASTGSATASPQADSRIYKPADAPLVARRDEIARAREAAPAVSPLQSGSISAKARWKSRAPAPVVPLAASPIKRPIPAGLVIVGTKAASVK